MAEIFVSYTSSDREWAEWIGQQLEKLEHVARLFDWEVGPGGDVMAWMDDRHNEADYVLCVVSSRYLDKEKRYSAMERQAAQLAAASGRPNFLLPVLIEDCEVPNLLALFKRCDLRGLEEAEARTRLADFMRPAVKRVDPVPFPGGKKAAIGGGTSPPQAAVSFPGKTAPQPKPRAGTISNIPIQTPLHFLGRNDDLAAIDRAFAGQGGRAAVTALHGLRGVGKTTLAAAYVERHRRDYRATWWVRAEAESTRRADLVGLGVRLGWVTAEEKEEHALTSVMQYLRDEGEGILIVFDNANNAEEFEKYSPRGEALRIIVTSNSPDWRGVAVPVEIEVWQPDIGANYLIERTGGADELDVALALSGLLGGLPLAHEQAAAYCGRIGIPLAEYKRRFERAPKIVLGDVHIAPGQYRRTVAKTFTLAIDEAAKLDPDAERLIVHASLLASEPIPLFLLSELKVQPGGEFNAAIEQGLDEAIARLRGFALVERETIRDERQPEIQTDSISLHRLVREIARSRFDEATNERMRGELITAMLAVYPKNVLNEPKTWSRARRLDSHAMALVGDAVSLPGGSEIQSAKLLSLLLAYRHATLSNSVEAKALAERALRVRQDKLGEEDPDTVTSLADLAWVLRDTGDPDDLARSETLARRAVEINEKKFGLNSLVTASSLHTLALTLHESGELDEAKLLFERDLAISEKELGEKDKETAVSHKSLAQLLHDLEDLPGATEHYKRALEIFETVSGAEHPDVATSACDLASVLRDQERFAEASPLYERALRVAQSALGPMHPVTGTILHNMGRLRQAEEKSDEAILLYRHALEIFDQKLGAQNSETQNLVDDLGGLLHDLERFAEALPLYQRALSETERKFGSNHPETAEALNNLGRLWDDQEEYDEALPLYRRALRIREQSPDVVETGLVLSNLGLLLHQQGKLDEALPVYQRALKISEQCHGADHEETGTALNNLGELFYDLKRFDDALPLFTRALEICERTDDPEIALVLSHLARTMRAKGDHKQARKLFKRARETGDANDE